MFLQHPRQAGLVTKRSYFETPAQGIPVELHRSQQPKSQALGVDQGTGETATHHRGDQGISSGPSAQAKEAPPLSQYYKELTGRCTRFQRTSRQDSRSDRGLSWRGNKELD